MSGFLDFAKTRRSVRTFDGNYVKPELIDDLKNFSTNIVNPYGIDITIAFHDAKEERLSSPVLAGEKCYVTAKVKKAPHAEEAYGYSFEAFLMHAHELGLGTVWIGGTMPREKFEAAANVQGDEIMPCVSPLGVTADKMSIKESLMRKGVKADTRLEFEKLFYENNINLPLSTDRAKEIGVLDALEAVRLAPSAVNKQPWRIIIRGNRAIFIENKDKAFANNAEYDLQKVDIGIAMYHFEQQLISDGKKPVFEVEKPDLDLASNMEYIITCKW